MLSRFLNSSRKLVALLAVLAFLLLLAWFNRSESMTDTLAWAGFASFTSFIGGNGVEHWQKSKSAKSEVTT